jgi:hypothetical protein
MFTKLRARLGRPSPATAIALLALFVALGGTGYAALKLPKNSVGTAQLKNNAVTGAKVKDGSLQAGDFGGTLPAGAKGDKGDPGTNGTNGTNGAPGTPGTNGNNGTPGTNGAPGGALKTKITGGPQNSAGANAPVTLTLPSFTPAANKAELVVIKVDWTTPPGSCAPMPTPPAGGQVFVKLDGNQLGSQVGPASGGSGATQSFTISAPIVSSASPTSHTVAVDVADNCNGPEDATINLATVERVEFSAAP